MTMASLPNKALVHSAAGARPEHPANALDAVVSATRASGKPDLIVANTMSTTVSLTLNSCVP
jgi:hypothetical protein